MALVTKFVLIVSPSSHPDYKYFLDVRAKTRNGTQLKALRAIDEQEMSKRVAAVKASTEKAAAQRIAAGAEQCTLEIIWECDKPHNM